MTARVAWHDLPVHDQADGERRQDQVDEPEIEDELGIALAAARVDEHRDRDDGPEDGEPVAALPSPTSPGRFCAVAR